MVGKFSIKYELPRYQYAIEKMKKHKVENIKIGMIKEIMI
jgi:hypothetical protein